MELSILVSRLNNEFDTLKLPPHDHHFPIEKANPQDLAKSIEHTNLKPETTREQIIKLCLEAEQYGFYGVCVNPVFTKDVRREVKVTRIVTVIGFPLGATSTKAKVEEAKQAIKDGANELDMVIQIGLLKAKEYKLVYDDIREVVKVAGRRPVKVIIEACLLNEEEKVAACLLAKRAGAAFVKTSTGFAKGGATVDDVALMQEVVGGRLGIKAAGGIKDIQSAKSMIEAGANRLGCSASVEIIGGGI